MSQAAPLEQEKRLDFIDALGGWAVLGVVLVHSFSDEMARLKPIPQAIVSSGACGVQLFYLVSAFTLFRSMDQKRHVPTPNLDFFLRRFFRVVPLYYFVLLYIALTSSAQFSAGNWISHFLFINGFSPFWINGIIGVEWSIAVEVAFYCLIPVLFRHIRTLDAAIGWTAISIGISKISIFLLRQYLASHPELSSTYDWQTFGALWLPSSLPVFLLGICLHFILSKRETIRSPYIYLGLALWGAAVAFARVNQLGLSHYVVSALIFMAFTVAMAARPLRLFINPLTVHIGKVSYSIYLIHLFSLSISAGWFQYLLLKFPFAVPELVRMPLQYVVNVALVTLIATATYYAIELPFIKLGGRLIRHLRARKAEHHITQMHPATMGVRYSGR